MNTNTIDDEKALILVVDDTPDNLTLMSSLLKDKYRVKVANNGNKALKIIEDNPPDLILLDVMMPEMSGYEVCSILKSDERKKDIPVIFLTAKTEATDEETGLNLGAVDYIAKPICPPLVMARINTQLQLKLAADFLKNKNNYLEKKVVERTQEMHKITSIFGQHVSPEIVEKLLAQPNEMTAENRTACVMFLDIRDFTTYSENLPPENVVEYLNKLFDFMIDIVNKHHGVINKFLGDGFMAVFGVPISDGNDTINAVQAGLEILEQVNTEIKNGTIDETRIGIGLHTGSLVTGNIGSSRRKEYTIIGDTVNLASRIENYNKALNSQMLVSESVWKEILPHLKNIFGNTTEEEDFALYTNLSFKGRNDTVNIYRIV